MRFTKEQLRKTVKEKADSVFEQEAKKRAGLARSFLVIGFLLGASAGGAAVYAAIRVFNVL